MATSNMSLSALAFASIVAFPMTAGVAVAATGPAPAVAPAVSDDIVTSDQVLVDVASAMADEIVPSLTAVVPTRAIVQFHAGSGDAAVIAALDSVDAFVTEFDEFSGMAVVETLNSGGFLDRLNGLDVVKTAELDGFAFTTSLYGDNDDDSVWTSNAFPGTGAFLTDFGDLALNEVIVGVVDSGVDITHPDLADRLWENPGEIPDNGIDDDDNGYIDDVHGWDWVCDQPYPRLALIDEGGTIANNPSGTISVDGNGDVLRDMTTCTSETTAGYDINGHGTHVAGSIAADHSNQIGISGVAPNAKILVARGLGDDGYGSSSDLQAAASYAVAEGAHVSNHSYGGTSSTYSSLSTVMGNNPNHLFVFAAGNNGANNDNSTSRMPTNLSDTHDNGLSVAAITDSDALASFSNYGMYKVQIGAPGQSILSTTTGGGWGYMSGTSMAAPQIAGVAALMRGLDSSMTGAAIRSKIVSTAETSTFPMGPSDIVSVPNIYASMTGAKIDQQIEWPVGMTDPRDLPDGSITAMVSASSRLPVTATSNTPSVCTYNGVLITYVDSGTCTLYAEQAGKATRCSAALGCGLCNTV